MPISLSNCLVKIFTKNMTNMASPICDRLISPNQTSFIKGRFVLENVAMTHVVIHEIHRTRSSGLVLKLDYENAYHRVSWYFLVEKFSFRGFGDKWIRSICSILPQSPFCVRRNDTNGCYFVCGKGLKQGDLLPPCFLTCSRMSFLRC